MSARFDFRATLWEFNGPASWYFLTLPQDMSAQIRGLTAGMRNSFGTLRVIATIGAATWRTSIFADTKRQAFLLPVKAVVRKKQRLSAGDDVAVSIEIDL